MKRVCLSVAFLAAALAMIGCASGAVAPTRLTIAVYPKGVGTSDVRHYTLRCNPARGNVPHPARACRVLHELAHPFAPVPPGTVCSALALGPQEAIVTGRLRGKPVHAHLMARGSCEIERWRRVSAVVPGFPGR
jgi:hypothetical protein